MKWRENPNVPLRWRAFGEAIIRARPDWESFVLGAVAGYGRYDVNDVRFIVEIPSPHPIVTSPLVAEIADPEGNHHIDVYWGHYFQHVGAAPWVAQKLHFEMAIRILRGIVDEELLAYIRYDEIGRPRAYHVRSFPLEKPLDQFKLKEGERIAVWSWRGSYDDRWPPLATP